MNDSAADANADRTPDGAKTPPGFIALTPPQPPPPIPDHDLLHLIGRGSYGQVWLARNRLGTWRAVKVVSREAFEDRKPFEREFKGIQRFEPISRAHDGLVDILQVGGAGDYFYYVMELADDANAEGGKRKAETSPRPVSGRPPDEPRSSGRQSAPFESGEDQSLLTSAATIPGFEARTDSGHSPFSIFEPRDYVPRTLRAEQQLRGGRLPVADCVRIGRLLASALDHLHRHNLVHRDVKPSNIIFVEGAPKLADIGLVADVSEARSFVGTEGFIPPEGPGTPRADLYSLGKVLYEISTGLDRRDFPALPAEFAPKPDAPATELAGTAKSEIRNPKLAPPRFSSSTASSPKPAGPNRRNVTYRRRRWRPTWPCSNKDARCGASEPGNDAGPSPGPQR